MTVRASRRGLLLAVAAAVALGLAARPAVGAEEKTLLARDGTLYVVRAGTGGELGFASSVVATNDHVIAWSSVRQDGAKSQGFIPGIVGNTFKHDIDLAFDEPTGSLIVLFTEEVSIFNVLRLGILKGDQWSVSNLLPTVGFPHVRNPQMLLSHQVVHSLDADGKDVSTTQSVLSVIWWEESNVSQARYAPVFLDDAPDPNGVQVYDLPALVGGATATSPDTHAAAAYMFPSLQFEGIGGAILASFADLNADRHYVVRIRYPDNLGKPGPDNVTWQRRRIPVVGIASEETITAEVPASIDSVKTVVGASYRPTLVWNTDTAVGYTRFDGRKWSRAVTIPLSDSMTYDRALRLVQEMATRN